ncbi:histone-like nucleoid-structuring protein Lsr2 [Angustibacter aerolatus]
MAQKVQVILEDDVDGSEGAETVQFALDGVSYEIDLSEANAKRLRDAFAEWVGHARRVSSRGGSGQRARRASSGSTGSNSSASAAAGTDTAAIRQWAKENGHEVSERGRISATVMDAYAAAH